MSQFSERIARLRDSMTSHGLFAWISLTSDPHASEYLPARWAERAWLSGFNGSYGTLVVTGSEALLWTDSRYWIQAGKQLAGSGIQLMKLGSSDVPSWIEWLSQAIPEKAVAGVAGDCLPLDVAAELRKALEEKGAKLCTTLDIAGEIWEKRPSLPSFSIYLSSKSPESCSSKLARLADQMQKAGADAFVTSAMDEIGWLTNLRGSDVPYNPVFLSHLIVDGGKAHVFLNEGCLPSDLRAQLESEGVMFHPYEEFHAALSRIHGKAVLADPSTISAASAEAIPSKARLINQLSPVALMKTRKSKAEIALIDEAMAKDGAALCRFYAWLEQTLWDNRKTITEMDVVERLHEERAKEEGFVSESFGTIAAVGANAALPHYTPSPECNSPLEGDTVLLIDSGAQYQEGTTDITRVTPIHLPSDAIRRDYTAVLRGHIQLFDAYFPEGTYASQLDTFARAPLWEVDADFGHGTGHGVGFFMNVHERPYSISPRSRPSEATRTVEGIVVSDEPGLYREGRWGIRIENLITPVIKAESEFGRFMGFRALTLCPIDTRLIVNRMMKSNEIAILNSYNLMVRNALKDRVTGAALDWLMKRTEIC